MRNVYSDLSFQLNNPTDDKSCTWVIWEGKTVRADLQACNRRAMRCLQLLLDAISTCFSKPFPPFHLRLAGFAQTA